MTGAATSTAPAAGTKPKRWGGGGGAPPAANGTVTVEVHLHDMPVPEQFRGRRVLLRAYEEMPVHDFGQG